MARRGGKKKGLVFAPMENWVKLRNDSRVVDMVNGLANEIAENAGGSSHEDMGYIVTDLVLHEARASASVIATGHAHFHNQKHHALLRALFEARRG